MNEINIDVIAWSLHVLPLTAWVFPTQSKDMQVRWIGYVTGIQ